MPGLVSDALIDRLRSWGSAGSSAVQAMASTRSWQLCTRPGGDPEYVQPRHEEMAAFLASGHAKYSGSPGVCLSTQGPGAIYLLRSSSVWAPVSRCPWSGSRCCPQDAPWHTGVMGHLGTTASSGCVLCCRCCSAIRTQLAGPRRRQRLPVAGAVRDAHEGTGGSAQPALVVGELSDHLAANAMVAVDVGSVTYWLPWVAACATAWLRR